MRAFRASVLILVFLILSIIVLSGVGRARIEAYRAAVPTEEIALDTAAEELSVLSARLHDERLLMALLFSHERCDELESATARCAAAARAEEDSEYAILRAELLGLLEAMERDLKPGILDIV